MDRKQIVIIGGSKGIGKSIVEEFISKDCNVIFSYCKSESDALATIENCKNDDVIVKAHYLDVTSKDSIQTFVEFVEHNCSKVHGIIYCTGIVNDQAMILMEDDSFEEVLLTNLHGCFYVIKSLLPIVDMNSGASIVIISSTGGIRPDAGQTNYAASKAGMIGLMESMAREFAEKKIRVNAVAPGFIETDMVNMENPKIQKSIAQIPMKRLGRTEEVAKAVYFLYSDDASYITAQTLVVDGGRL